MSQYTKPCHSSPIARFHFILLGYSAGAIALLTFLQHFPSVQKYIAGIVIVGGAFQVDHTARAWLLEHSYLARLVNKLMFWE